MQQRQKMPRRAFPFAFIVSVFSFLIAPVAVYAQQRDAMEVCLGRGGVTPDERIAACSSIIEAGNQTKEQLALGYGNRGVARAHKDDLESARKDYE